VVRQPFLVACVVAWLIGSVLPGGSAPSNCRIYLAGQYSWERNLGFYLDFEGSSLESLPVILGVADGEQWRFCSHAPGFSTGQDYRIQATIGPRGATLALDGTLVAEMPCVLKPYSGPLEVNYRPPWANEKGDWLSIVKSAGVTVSRDGEQPDVRQFDYSDLHDRPIALQLFEPGIPRRGEIDIRQGDAVAIDVVLRFVSPDLRRWAPFIDRYGQCTYAAWPEKVGNDEELRADIALEDSRLAGMPPPDDRDAYGGYTRAGWSQEATGFFYTVLRDGIHWLITPEGNPCYYLGVCNLPGSGWPTTPVSGREMLFSELPSRQGAMKAAWSANHWGGRDGTEYICLHTANLIRKYGPEDWSARALERCLQRVRCWGFAGGGKWGAPPDVVATPVLNRAGVPDLVEHPDVFDPAVCQTFRESLVKQVTPRRDDPYVLGWSLGNEYPEIIKPAEIRAILAMPEGTPAKRALIDYAMERIYDGSLAGLADAWKVNAANRATLYSSNPSPPAEDIEKLRCHYADAYYGFIYRTVKSIDPNHLYLGFWIVPGWWVNESDWIVGARHCDVIGYDRYRREYPEERLTRLQQATDKPTLCGEFSFPAWYEGARGYGRYGVSAGDDAEAGELYHNWLRGGARDPYSVGMLWFHYRDQALTGRGPGRGEELVFGEHFAFGLITEQDRPKWPMVTRMREANLRAPIWRMQGGK